MGDNEKNYNFEEAFKMYKIYAPIIGVDHIARLIENIDKIIEFYKDEEMWETVHILQNMRIYFESKHNEIRRGIIK